MEQMTTEQRIQVIKSYYSNNESSTAAVRELRAKLGRNVAPNESSVRKLIRKFETTGSVTNVKGTGRPRSARTEENIAVVRNSVSTSPGKSVRRRAQQLNLSPSSLHQILSKDLKMHAYKIQLIQELKPADHGKRHRFAQWVMARQTENENFTKKIFFSDEAHFHLSGYVNKQNCRIWGNENPRVSAEHQMHPLRTTVWCGFWAGGVIGPFFFEDDEEAAVTVNGDRYRNMLSDWFYPALDGMENNDHWFQQDGATCHTSRETIALLNEKFPQKVISLRGNQEWPARSCDLTPCDFFLWGFIKSKVYVNKPQTIPQLKAEIRRVINGISPDVCERVLANFNERITQCRASLGSHMADIIFHT
jgi:Helix-turn-helix domain (DUF4817)